MKKIFTLSAAIFLAATAFAQDAVKQAIDLTGRNIVLYTTNGELNVASEENAYYAGDLANNMNKLGMAYEAGSEKNSIAVVYQREDYTDPETGFTLPRSAYRPMTVTQGTVNFYGKFAMSETDVRDVVGFKNIKKAIIYMVGWGGNANNGWRDCPSGARWQARYVDEAGEKVSNICYVETTASKDYVESVASDVLKNDYLNCTYDPACGDNMAYDHPFKLVVDLTNTTEPGTLEFESDTKKSEYKKIDITKLKELAIPYYFCKTGTACASTTGEHSTLESASGFDQCSGKWGEKASWSKETIVQLSFKRNAAIVGIAFISADDDAKNVYADATYVEDGEFHETGISAWVDTEAEFPSWVGGGADGIEDIKADVKASKAVYNIAGQQVGAGFRGIVIENGVKRVK